jgi:5'-methylthioadenosine phosphorylase
MGRLGVIGGSSLLGSEERLGARGHVFLQRHGAAPGYRLPHAIDHAANLRRLAEGGCDRVLALGSVGGLHAELGVGSAIAPDDFISPGRSPSIHTGPEAHRVARFDPAWRSEVVARWQHEAGIPIRDGGVYWETAGPRFETPAEIRLIAAHADVVGMTIASECTIAGEIGLPYAAICIVDNLANGVAGEEVSPEALEAARARNREALLAALEKVLPALGEA